MFARFSPYWVWFLLSLPALGMVQTLLGDDARAFHRLLHPTGEFAARFMILSMMATPLMMLTKGAWFARWLRGNRRYFGVAAFGYAALHTVVYLIDKADVTRILTEATRFEFWTGWVAFAIFLPLAATSMDYAVRKLGRRWKTVQRWTYAAAVLTLLHWASLHNWGGVTPALVHFAPLAGLTAYRLWWQYLRVRPTVAQGAL
jgi:sulfoxide reductase heme-binding subunit YedZ